MNNDTENSYIQNRAAWEIRIDGMVKSMTSSERRIADYIRENPDKVITLSITEVAENCGTSEATIVRFCRHMGYKGFQDLKISIAQSKVSSLQVIYQGISEHSTVPEIKEQVFMSSIGAMRDTLEILDDSELQKAVDALYGAKKIDIYGMGGSFVIAEDARHKFLKIGIRCEIYSDGHMQIMSASQLGPGDVVIGISYSGSSKDVLEAMELAHNNGATTICITHMAKSPIVGISDIKLNVTAQDMMFRSDAVVSRMAQFAIIDILYVGLGIKMGNKAFDTIENGRKASTIKGF